MEEKDLLRKVLVPVDGSESSLLALQTTRTIAKKTGATVTILHVIRAMEEYYRILYAAQGLAYDIPRNVIMEIIKFTEKESNKIVNDAQALLSEEEIIADIKILRDIDPADSILEFSKKDHYDLIVMGARGKNEKEPYALGSVTKKVIRHTTCPILFTKRDCDLSNLLICIDGSEYSIKALNYVVKFSEGIGSKITLLYVQEPRLHTSSPKVAQELSERIFSRASGAIERRGLEFDKKVEFGVISDSIIEFAEKWNYDLIVLGSRGLGTAKRFLLGSVSDVVSHKAKCSVLIFPAKRET
ncbi:MAG: universal stress protein [Candidatus Methylarchaceae archaeon HK02M2]|nr:universal stress protein [Candidatus Methylarchaceae archaeon HK02M2]